MAKNAYQIWDLYESKSTPSRDAMVQEMVATYFKENVSVLSDGIINQIPVISTSSRDSINKYYNVTDDEYKILEKTNAEVKRMLQLSSTLKLGLIISYIKTGKPIFLNYLSILLYSSLYFKYFRNGCNRPVLKYTIETQDNRTDFKRYDMSLIVVVTKKVEVIIDHIKKSRYIDSNGKCSDQNLRMILQAVGTRFNSMLRTLCSKYMENMKDDSVKVMMQYSKTLDGKDVISPLNVVETVRDKANDNLRIPSFKALNMSSLNLPHNKKYKDYFIVNYSNNFNTLTELNNSIINEWLKRNPKMNITDFKNKFASDMSTARNIGYIHDTIDSMYEKDLSPESEKLNRADYRKFIYKFMLANIVVSTLDVVKKS